MPKKLLRRYMPDKETVKNSRHLKIFGSLLHDTNLWHLNRNSTARAFSVGLFSAMMPIPFQMILSAFLAIVFRCNLPIAVALVWLTNPITMPPIFYFAYILGARILHIPPGVFHFELSFSWLMHKMVDIWEPFLLGCFMMGISFALLGNVGIRLFWRYWIVRSWRLRKKQMPPMNT